MGLPIINLSLIPTFPARVFGSGPIVITKAGLDYTFSWDASTYSLNPAPSASAQVLSYDPSTGATELIAAGSVAADWDSIVNKPATFPPSAHTHPISEVDSLQSALDAKINTTEIGVSVQAYDADLAAIAALSGTNNIYYRSGANTWSSVTIGSGLTFTGGTLAATAVSGTTPRGYVYGLNLSNNVADATNDIDIATGEASSDGTTPALMALTSAVTKRLDAAWAVGSGNGGLDTGSIANTTYHVWLIQRSDTSVVDALFSTSATSPTMPTNYDRKRRIGSIVRSGGSIQGFITAGNGANRRYEWTAAPALSMDTTIGTTATLATLALPTGIVVDALLNLYATNAGAGTVVYVYSPNKTDQAASTSATPLAQVTTTTTGLGTAAGVSSLTNTSAQVKVVAIAASTTVRIATIGWTDFL